MYQVDGNGRADGQMRSKTGVLLYAKGTLLDLVVKSKSFVFREGNEAVELAKTRTLPFCHRYEVGFARRMGTTTIHAGEPSEKRYLC
jgi:hypothetical protein